MNGVHLPARALRTIAEFVRVEFLSLLSERRLQAMGDGSADITLHRLTLGARPRFLKPRQVCVACRPGPLGALREVVAFSTSGGEHRVFAHFGGSPFYTDSSRAFSCMDTSASPPRLLRVTDDRDMHRCLGAMTVSGCFARLPEGWKDAEPAGRRAIAEPAGRRHPPDCPSPQGEGQLPGSPDVVAVGCSVAARSNGWNVYLLDLQRVAILRCLTVVPRDSMCINPPRVLTLKGDADHIYLVGRDITGPRYGYRVCVRTGAILASIEVEEDDDEPRTLAMVPLADDRWAVFDSRGDVRLIGGGAETREGGGSISAEFKRAAFGKRLGFLDGAWSMGDGRVLLFNASAQEILMGELVDGRFRFLSRLQGNHTLLAVTAVHCSGLPAASRNDTVVVMLRTPDAPYLIVLVEGDRLRGQYVSHLPVGYGTMEHPAFAAVYKQICQQQEARVARGSS